MKTIFTAIVISIAIASCGESKSHQHDSTTAPLTQADSLYEEIMQLHDAVMPKMGKVRGARDYAQHLIDSINKLSVKSKAGLQVYESQLQELAVELNNADVEMDNWMMAFNMDSLTNDQAKRVLYFTEEKQKVTKVKEAVLGSLAKADSLFKK
jgi:hypothetical protein